MFVSPTWCTVHIGNGVFVAGLLHIVPAAEVRELNMTWNETEDKTDLWNYLLKLPQSEVTLIQLSQLFTHLWNTSFLLSLPPLYIPLWAFQANSLSDYSCLAATR